MLRCSQQNNSNSGLLHLEDTTHADAKRIKNTINSSLYAAKAGKFESSNSSRIYGLTAFSGKNVVIIGGEMIHKSELANYMPDVLSGKHCML